MTISGYWSGIEHSVDVDGLMMTDTKSKRFFASLPKNFRQPRWRIFVGLLFACTVVAMVVTYNRTPTYSFGTHREHTRHPVTIGYIADLLEKQNGWNVKILAGKKYNFVDNVALVEKKEVDFAMSSSDVAGNSLNVRTVLPIYPEVLLVLYSESLGNPKTFEELLIGNKVGVGPKDLPLAKHLLKLISDFGIEESTFTPVYNALDDIRPGTDQMDVVFTFVETDELEIQEILEDGNRIFSLDDPELAGRGSRVDGYLLRRPYLRSMILPKNSFGKFPSEPVLTLAVPMTIITHSSMDDNVVHDFVATVYENSGSLFRQTSILGLLSEEFDANRLNFPIHEGTLQYLNRDQPSFLERYAEVIALIISVVIIVYGAVAAGHQLLLQRNKDRIDIYFEKIREFGDRFPNSLEEAEQALLQLHQLKGQAIKQVEKELLSANQSFSIFLELVHYEIVRMEKLQSHFESSTPNK